MAGKATEAEVEERVAVVTGFVIDGMQRAAIVRYCAKRYGVKSRATDKYIAYARKAIKEDAAARTEGKFELIDRRLERLYRKAIIAENWQTARNILKDLRDLHGLDRPAKIHHTFDEVKEAEKALDGATEKELEDILTAANEIIASTISDGNGNSNGNGRKA